MRALLAFCLFLAVCVPVVAQAPESLTRPVMACWYVYEYPGTQSDPIKCVPILLPRFDAPMSRAERAEVSAIVREHAPPVYDFVVVRDVGADSWRKPKVRAN